MHLGVHIGAIDPVEYDPLQFRDLTVPSLRLALHGLFTSRHQFIGEPCPLLIVGIQNLDLVFHIIEGIKEV